MLQCHLAAGLRSAHAFSETPNDASKVVDIFTVFDPRAPLPATIQPVSPSGLSAAAIAGIVVASTVGALATAGASFALYKRMLFQRIRSSIVPVCVPPEHSFCSLSRVLTGHRADSSRVKLFETTTGLWRCSVLSAARRVPSSLCSCRTNAATPSAAATTRCFPPVPPRHNPSWHAVYGAKTSLCVISNITLLLYFCSLLSLVPVYLCLRGPFDLGAALKFKLDHAARVAPHPADTPL